MFLDMTDTFAVVLFHTYRECMFLESCHKGVHCQLISFPVLHLHGAWCCCHGVVHGKGMTRAPCPRVCSPQTVPCCLQSPAGETLLGAKHLWCSACFSILWVREGGREEIISINLCYPIMGIFDWKTCHKEKAWKLNNERISGYPSLLSLFQQMSGGALSSQLWDHWCQPLGAGLGHCWGRLKNPTYESNKLY